jgi:hypothetical protein
MSMNQARKNIEGRVLPSDQSSRSGLLLPGQLSGSKSCCTRSKRYGRTAALAATVDPPAWHVRCSGRRHLPRTDSKDERCLVIYAE